MWSTLGLMKNLAFANSTVLPNEWVRHTSCLTQMCYGQLHLFTGNFQEEEENPNLPQAYLDTISALVIRVSTPKETGALKVELISYQKIFCTDRPHFQCKHLLADSLCCKESKILSWAGVAE